MSIITSTTANCPTNKTPVNQHLSQRRRTSTFRTTKSFRRCNTQRSSPSWLQPPALSQRLSLRPNQLGLSKISSAHAPQMALHATTATPSTPTTDPRRRSAHTPSPAPARTQQHARLTRTSPAATTESAAPGRDNLERITDSRL